jgi:hypothetical protein
MQVPGWYRGVMGCIANLPRTYSNQAGLVVGMRSHNSRSSKSGLVKNGLVWTLSAIFAEYINFLFQRSPSSFDFRTNIGSITSHLI